MHGHALFCGMYFRTISPWKKVQLAYIIELAKKKGGRGSVAAREIYVQKKRMETVYR